jgi:hypothetical protein
MDTDFMYTDFVFADHDNPAEWHKDADLRMAGRPAVLLGEDPELLAMLRCALEEEFKPTTMYQSMLVDDIAQIEWELRRERRFRDSITNGEACLLIERARQDLRQDAMREKAGRPLLSRLIEDLRGTEFEKIVGGDPEPVSADDTEELTPDETTTPDSQPEIEPDPTATVPRSLIVAAAIREEALQRNVQTYNRNIADLERRRSKLRAELRQLKREAKLDQVEDAKVEYDE